MTCIFFFLRSATIVDYHFVQRPPPTFSLISHACLANFLKVHFAYAEFGGMAVLQLLCLWNLFKIYSQFPLQDSHSFSHSYIHSFSRSYRHSFSLYIFLDKICEDSATKAINLWTDKDFSDGYTIILLYCI